MTKIITLSANTSWYLFNFRKNTILALKKNGYQVACLSSRDLYTKKLIELGCIWKEINLESSGSNPYQDLKLLISLFLTYRKLKPIAAFHFTIKNNIYGTIAASLLKIKSINNISGLGTSFIHNNFKSFIAKSLYRMVLPFSFIVHVQNEEDQIFLERTIPSIINSIHLIPGSGVDTERFSPALKNKQPHQSKPFKFLFAGRFLADKGLYEIIDAVAAINFYKIQCEFWLVGFQDSKNISAIKPSEIEQWKKISGLKIFEPTDELELILAEVDCFVLPSYREGMPKSVLEACSMSLPVICSNVAGCRNIITDGENGFLCEPKSADSLRAVMDKVLQLPFSDLKILGSNGRDRVKKYFDEKIVINEALSIIQKIEVNEKLYREKR